MAKLGWGAVLLSLLIGLAFAFSRWQKSLPTTSTLTETHSQTPLIPSSNPETLSSVDESFTEKWNEIEKGVTALDDRDQRGLDLLYERARDAIRKNEPLAIATLSQRIIKSLTLKPVNESLKQGYFAINSWIRYSNSPAHVLTAIWNSRPAKSPQINPHRREMNPSEIHTRLEAHALRELRKQQVAGAIEIKNESKQEIVGNLLIRGREERSLNLILEIVQLLKSLGEDSAVEEILKGLPARDQKLVREVVS